MTARRFTLAALALALLTTACSEDAVSPGVPDARSVRGARAPAPQHTTIEGTSIDRQTVYVEGVRYDFERVHSDGSVTQTRILKNGGLFITFGSDISTLQETQVVAAAVYDEGSLVLDQSLVIMSGLSSAPGPQRQMSLDDLPCLDELALFAAASAVLSYELYRARYGTGSLRRIASASAAFIWAGRKLWLCLRHADTMPQLAR